MSLVDALFLSHRSLVVLVHLRGWPMRVHLELLVLVLVRR
jgi:hypothetical protein